MKILNQKDSVWKKNFTCSECKSELEVSRDDLVVRNYAVSYAGETWEPEVCFVCPVCISTNQISAHVPSGLRSLLFDAARPRH